MRESGIEAVFRRAVRDKGGWPIKMMPTVKGLPDRLVVWPGGRVQFVELKTTSGRVSAAQRVIHNRLAALGCPVQLLCGPLEVREWSTRRGLPAR